MRINKYWYCLAFCAALSGISVPASAANFSFQGIFSTDDQMATFQFVASGSSPVIFTSSYNAGGFVTALSLFGPGTPLQASTPLIGQDSLGLGDSLLDTAAPPITIVSGQTYWVVLTQWDNTPIGPNFGNGFTETGNPNFTSTFGCGTGLFVDCNTFSNRTGDWALNINGVTSAQLADVPEPGTFLMLGAALASVLAARRLKSATR